MPVCITRSAAFCFVAMDQNKDEDTSLHGCAGDPPPERKIDADTSDDEDAPITSNDESFAAVAAIRVGY